MKGIILQAKQMIALNSPYIISLCDPNPAYSITKPPLKIFPPQKHLIGSPTAPLFQRGRIPPLKTLWPILTYFPSTVNLGRVWVVACSQGLSVDVCWDLLLGGMTRVLGVAFLRLYEGLGLWGDLGWFVGHLLYVMLLVELLDTTFSLCKRSL